MFSDYCLNSHFSLWPGGKHIGGCTGTFLWHNFFLFFFLIKVLNHSKEMYIASLISIIGFVLQILWNYTEKENSNLCYLKLMLKIQRPKVQATICFLSHLLTDLLLMFSILLQETLALLVRKMMYVKLFGCICYKELQTCTWNKRAFYYHLESCFIDIFFEVFICCCNDKRPVIPSANKVIFFEVMRCIVV